VYAAYLKPGKHQIIVYDKSKDKFWAKNIVVEMRKSEAIAGKFILFFDLWCRLSQ
jgi:hypothetical protein